MDEDNEVDIEAVEEMPDDLDELDNDISPEPKELIDLEVSDSNFKIGRMAKDLVGGSVATLAYTYPVAEGYS